MRAKIVSFLMGVIFTVTVLTVALTAVAKQGSEYVKINYNNIKATFNGEVLNLTDSTGKQVEPFILNGSTYIPMRAFAQALGINVDWDEKTKTVAFYDDDYEPDAIQDSFNDSYDNTPEDYSTYQDSEDVSNMVAEELRLVNEERTKAGLKPLTINEKLQPAAMTRAEEITRLFEHERPDGREVWSVYKDYGVSYRAVGENIAYGQTSPKDVMNSWMNSPGHRANILSRDYSQIAIGIYNKGGTLYWVQLFLG